jgi:TPR repeat protein
MYQFGQGVQQDDARAVAWYSLSADRGSLHGQNNLQAFRYELEDRGEGVWEAANARVNDAAIARAQRWADIQDLRARITGLESDAVQNDLTADQLEGKGKKDNSGVAKVINALGTVGAVKFRVEAEKYRVEAARLREQLARLENQDQASASVPQP